MRLLLSILLTALFAHGAAAQTWPDRSVRMIVPFPAGGATDVTARILAEELTATFKQTFIVDTALSDQDRPVRFAVREGQRGAFWSAATLAASAPRSAHR